MSHSGPGSEDWNGPGERYVDDPAEQKPDLLPLPPLTRFESDHLQLDDDAHLSGNCGFRRNREQAVHVHDEADSAREDQSSHEFLQSGAWIQSCKMSERWDIFILSMGLFFRGMRLKLKLLSVTYSHLALDECSKTGQRVIKLDDLTQFVVN